MMTELVREVGIPIIRKVTATWDVTKDLLIQRITGDVRLGLQVRYELAVRITSRRIPTHDELRQHGGMQLRWTNNIVVDKFKPR